MKTQSWVVALAGASLIVSIFALVESRHHDLVSVAPLVNFYTEDGDDQPIVGLEIENTGAGPAIIRSITYYVDDIPVKDAFEATDKWGFDPGLIREIEYDDGDALGAGEKVWLYSRSTKNKKELNRFLDFIDDHLSIAVRYCSLDNDCKTRCSDSKGCAQGPAQSKGAGHD